MKTQTNTEKESSIKLNTQTVSINKTVQFDIKNIESVYIGKPGLCRCGCAGDYYYNLKDENYKLNDEEMIKKVLRKFETTKLKIENIEDYILNINMKTKSFTIYLKRDGV